MPDYSLCQILIPSVAGLLPGRAMYPVGMNGRYEAKLIGVTWADRTQDKDNRVIYIRSDSFRKPYGSVGNAIMICNKHQASMGNPQGEFPFYIETTGGGIDITLEASTAYTGGNGNQHFDFCILTLAVMPLD